MPHNNVTNLAGSPKAGAGYLPVQGKAIAMSAASNGWFAELQARLATIVNGGANKRKDDWAGLVGPLFAMAGAAGAAAGAALFRPFEEFSSEDQEKINSNTVEMYDWLKAPDNQFHNLAVYATPGRFQPYVRETVMTWFSMSLEERIRIGSGGDGNWNPDVIPLNWFSDDLTDRLSVPGSYLDAIWNGEIEEALKDVAPALRVTLVEALFKEWRADLEHVDAEGEHDQIPNPRWTLRRFGEIDTIAKDGQTLPQPAVAAARMDEPAVPLMEQDQKNELLRKEAIGLIREAEGKERLGIPEAKGLYDRAVGVIGQISYSPRSLEDLNNLRWLAETHIRAGEYRLGVEAYMRLLASEASGSLAGLPTGQQAELIERAIREWAGMSETDRQRIIDTHAFNPRNAPPLDFILGRCAAMMADAARRAAAEGMTGKTADRPEEDRREGVKISRDGKVL